MAIALNFLFVFQNFGEMSRKVYGEPYTKRHIRRIIAKKRTSLMKDINDRFLEYLDLATNNVPSNDIDIKESGINVNNTSVNEDVNNISFAAYINILSTNKHCNAASSSKLEHDILSIDKLSTNNVNSPLKGIPQCGGSNQNNDVIHNVQQVHCAELDRQNTEINEDNKDYVWRLLQNIEDYEESSDCESNSSGENDCSSENDKNVQFVDSIRKWSINYVHTIPHNAINDVLQILIEHTDAPFPKDARTLLKTPRSTEVHNMSNGQYCHYGLKQALSVFILDMIKKHINVDSVELLVNIDGAPLAKSSEKGLWIISCSETVLNDVELVGIYHGEDKPSDSNELLQMFVDELKTLVNDGFQFNDKLYKINLRAIICDAPAKAYVIKVKYPTGYNSCTKCQIEGKWLNKVCFPGYISTLRTDSAFDEYDYIDEEYQRAKTILCDIPNFGLVTNVVLDYMHLVCLGITLKLIELWLKGSVNVKLSELQRKTISERLVNLKSFMPSDFSRKPRNFENVRRLWKAHELRQFLLYSGPVVLCNVLNNDMYLHFLYLHVAISILVNRKLCCNSDYLNFAELLLKKFVEGFQILYGPENMTHNVHNLLHLVGDVRNFGCLDDFSAFRFENHIRKIKQLVRKGDKPLQQIHRRLGEIFACKDYSAEKNIEPSQLKKNHFDGPLVPSLHYQNQFQILCKNSLYLNVRDSRNNCVLLKDGSIVECLNFIETKNNSKHIVGKPFKIISNFYSAPFDSDKLNINVVKYSDENMQTYACNLILAKLCKMPYERNFVIFPLIHTYDVNG